MKKLIATLTLSLISLISFSQADTLNKLDYTSGDILFIKSNQNTLKFVDSEKEYTYGQGEHFNSSGVLHNSDSIKGIDADLKTFGRDTLSSVKVGNEIVYGVDSSFTYDGSNYDANIPVSHMTTYDNVIYVMRKYVDDRVTLNGTNTNNNNINYLGEYSNFDIDGFKEINSLEYFNLNGTNYVILSYLNYYSDNVSVICNIDTNIMNYKKIDDNVGDKRYFKYIDNILYYSENQSIYKVNSFTPHQSNPNVKHINSTKEYEIIDTSITINDFEIYNDHMYVATNDGVYSNNPNQAVLNTTEENILDNVILYPNPNTGTFTIDNLEYDTKINIVNQNGQVIYSTVSDYSTAEIQLEYDVPKGLYFVQLTNKNTSKVVKFIKQ